MILNFLRSKVGISLLAALALIAVAISIKSRGAESSQNLQSQISLIAETSVKNAIANGQQSNLDALLGTSTVDDRIAALEAKSASATPETLTATDRFAREFFTQYMALKQSGATIDENTGTNLVNQLLAQDYGGPTEEKTYSTADIQVLNTSSLSAIKNYGNALGSILGQPLPKGYESELIIVARVNDTGDATDLAKLTLNIARYQSLRDKIAELPVPNPLKEVHVALINSLSAILEGVRGMALIQTDPVGATKMIARYQDGLGALQLSLQTIKTYMVRQNISFASTESGYVLTQ